MRLARLGYAVNVLLLLWRLGTPQAVAGQARARTMGPDSILAHVRILAGDDLGGRGAGSEGYTKAARYAAEAFRRAGALPLGDAGSFLQAFSAEHRRTHQVVESVNVVALIAGRDPGLRDELVSIGAHLDGLGVRDGVIYNGANDNATGAAVVLEVARALAAEPPRRSVLLALWGSEEIGMLGSRYFVDHPTVELDRMVAHVNLDGIGRYDRSPGDTVRVFALGAENICAALGEELRAAARATDVELRADDPNGWFQHSDHYNFHLAGVPSVFITDVGSADYHKPTDDTEFIDKGKLARTATMGLALVRALADRDEPVCPGARGE